MAGKLGDLTIVNHLSAFNQAYPLKKKYNNNWRYP
jgi:hypothetical protein